MKLEIGDRVAVYDSRHRLVATVTEVSYTDSMLYVQNKDGYQFWASAKQCRKLVKKERRRVFIPEYALDALDKDDPKLQAYQLSLEKTASDDVEFVEVRRQKGKRK